MASSAKSADGLGPIDAPGPLVAQATDPFGPVVRAKGTRKAVSQGEFDAFMTKVYALAGATSADSKAAVRRDLLFTWGTGGTGDRIQWETLPFAPVGCAGRATYAEVVGLMTPGRSVKHYAVWLHDDLVVAYNTSQVFRDALAEKAARLGLGADAILAIDCLDSAKLSSVSRHIRQVAKDTAIRRQGANVVAEQRQREADGAELRSAQFGSVGPVGGAGDAFGAY